MSCASRGVGHAPADEVATKSGKAGLDSDFLDGLMDDPLAKNKPGKK